MARHPAFLIIAIWAAGLGAAAQFGKISILFDDLVAIYGGAGRIALMVSVVGWSGWCSAPRRDWWCNGWVYVRCCWGRWGWAPPSRPFRPCCPPIR